MTLRSLFCAPTTRQAVSNSASAIGLALLPEAGGTRNGTGFGDAQNTASLVRHVLIAKQQPWYGTTYDGETPLEAAEDLPDFNEH